MGSNKPGLFSKSGATLTLSHELTSESDTENVTVCPATGLDGEWVNVGFTATKPAQTDILEQSVKSEMKIICLNVEFISSEFAC